MKQTQRLRSALTWGVALLSCAAVEAASPEAVSTPATKVAVPGFFHTSRSYNEFLLKQVDAAVRKNLYNPDLVTSAWVPAIERDREKILRSKNLSELFQTINRTMAELKSSHCEFVTSNDETFYFLHGIFRKRLEIPQTFVGFVVGPPRFEKDTVRYVLDDSPAQKAGILVGDKILTVNGAPYVGEANFVRTAGKTTEVGLERDGKVMSLNITPIAKSIYQGYVDAIAKSAKTFKVGKYNIGYVHDWCGGGPAHEELEDVLSNMQATDGIILDLRDGYGGNSIEDLDFFYRTANACPVFAVKPRDGKPAMVKYQYYEKPVVALINDGSRSGKEWLALSLKQTKRAPLIGSNTAGAFLGGSLFKLDKNAALYLAVFDCTVGGIRLEGKGVAPDIVVDDRCSAAGKQEQLEKAKEKLVEILNSSESAATQSSAH